MRDYTINCDNCGADLKGGKGRRWRVHLASEIVASMDEIDFDLVHVAPPIDRPKDFCNLDCLEVWVVARSISSGAATLDGGHLFGVHITTHDEFVGRYCGDQIPTPLQSSWIEALLDLESRVMVGGRGIGKSTFIEWGRRYFADLDRRKASHSDS